MKDTIEKLVREGLQELAGTLGQVPRDERKGREEVVIEHPVDLGNGDYSTNAALVTAKQFKQSPREVAEKLAHFIDAHKPETIDKIEIAGPCFINFYLSKQFFADSLKEIIEKGERFGQTNLYSGEKVMVEHTDPNPFKEIHIGHLMPNVIGSTVARIYGWNGAEVAEAIYMGDVGLHVAKAVWALRKNGLEPTGDLRQDAQTVGQAYAEGNQAYETEAGPEIVQLNKVIYERSDAAVNRLYDEWKEVSLKYFDDIFKKLGTKFDYTFYESGAAVIGKEAVESKMGEIFELSDGAVVFHAEKYDPTLHTRVFVNSQGLPTYEAKELGLAKMKYDVFPYDKSVVVTGNEIKDYFRVLLAAMRYVYPELALRTKHLPHGMLRLLTGKMSSRTGKVVPALWLIEEVKKVISERGQEATDEIAVGAVKYMILKQAIGGDIIFDFDKSVSTEGDSGPYLQYAYARTRSLLEKAQESNLTPNPSPSEGEGGPLAMGEVRAIERLLYRFPEVVARAGREYAPHYITTYLIELASAYNSFYASEQVIAADPEAPYRLAIVAAFAHVLKNGLTILGIPTPERM